MFCLSSYGVQYFEDNKTSFETTRSNIKIYVIEGPTWDDNEVKEFLIKPFDLVAFFFFFRHIIIIQKLSFCQLWS